MILHSSRVMLALVSAAILVGCAHDCCIDDWGTAGYARVRGTAVLASGVPLARRGVSYLCGSDGPTEFGYQGLTDAAGAFDLAIDAPGPIELRADSTLICRFSAPADSLPRMELVDTVRFGIRQLERPITVIELREP